MAKDYAKLALERLEKDAIFPYSTLQPMLVVVHKKEMAPGERSYFQALRKAGKKYGALVNDCIANTPIEVSQYINALAAEPNIHGIIIISDYGNMNRTLYNMIPLRLDIDSLSALSLGNLLDSRSPIAYRNAPCTAVACLKILEEIESRDDFSNRNCLIINRSIRVGRPLAEILTQKNMTVTLAHSKTANDVFSDNYDAQYDYVVTAIGKPNYWGHDKGQELLPNNGDLAVLDVGVSKDPQTGELCGDVDKQAWDYNIDGDDENFVLIHDGIGTLTTAVLFAKLFNNAAEFFMSSGGIYYPPQPQLQEEPPTMIEPNENSSTGPSVSY